MMMLIRCFGLCGLLAACSGGGGGDAPSFAARADDYAAQLAAALLVDVTPFPQLPDTGAATYRGTARMAMPLAEEAGRITVLGDLGVTVTFGPSDTPVVGAITGMETAAGRVAGRINLTDAAFDPDAQPDLDYMFTGDLSGTLTYQDTEYRVLGDFAGDLRGRNADTMTGVVFGALIDQSEISAFDGDFVATTP